MTPVGGIDVVLETMRWNAIQLLVYCWFCLGRLNYNIISFAVHSRGLNFIIFAASSNITTRYNDEMMGYIPFYALSSTEFGCHFRPLEGVVNSKSGNEISRSLVVRRNLCDEQEAPNFCGSDVSNCIQYCYH